MRQVSVRTRISTIRSTPRNGREPKSSGSERTAFARILENNNFSHWKTLGFFFFFASNSFHSLLHERYFFFVLLSLFRFLHFYPKIVFFPWKARFFIDFSKKLIDLLQLREEEEKARRGAEADRFSRLRRGGFDLFVRRGRDLPRPLPDPQSSRWRWYILKIDNKRGLTCKLPHSFPFEISKILNRVFDDDTF